MSDPSEKYPVFIIHTKGCFRQKTADRKDVQNTDITKTAEIAKTETAAEKDYLKRP